MYDKFAQVLRIECTCNNVGAFRVKREVSHRDGSVTEQKAPLKKSIYSLYQLFIIMKAANYRYLEFVSSFDDNSDGKRKLIEVTSPVKENERSYRGLNFFEKRDLLILETISRGEYMTFGMQGKDIRGRIAGLSSSAMSRVFKRLRLHGLIERVQGSYKYFVTALGKEIIAAGLVIKNLVLIPALV
jgi:DNA-binding MarR family transcriptional regulator